MRQLSIILLLLALISTDSAWSANTCEGLFLKKEISSASDLLSLANIAQPNGKYDRRAANRVSIKRLYSQENGSIVSLTYEISPQAHTLRYFVKIKVESMPEEQITEFSNKLEVDLDARYSDARLGAAKKVFENGAWVEHTIPREFYVHSPFRHPLTIQEAHVFFVAMDGILAKHLNDYVVQDSINGTIVGD